MSMYMKEVLVTNNLINLLRNTKSGTWETPTLGHTRVPRRSKHAKLTGHIRC